MAQYMNEDAQRERFKGKSHEEIQKELDEESARLQEREINRRVMELDNIIRNLQMQIEAMKGMRNSQPQISAIQKSLDMQIAKKVELTNARGIQDEVVGPTEDEVVQEYRKGNATIEDVQEARERKLDGPKSRTIHNTYKFEELFHENIDGDLIMTLPDEVMEALKLKIGDTMGISTNANGLVLKKV
jgi:hypothetical protein